MSGHLIGYRIRAHLGAARFALRLVFVPRAERQAIVEARVAELQARFDAIRSDALVEQAQAVLRAAHVPDEVVPAVLERRACFDRDGDYANLACGHQVWVPSDWPAEIDCGECRAGARGERSAPRWISFDPPASDERRPVVYNSVSEIGGDVRPDSVR